jgi:hypothetical protein
MASFNGCLAFCGRGLQAHAWDDINQSLTTWILPLLGGLLLQVPFESSNTVGDMLLQAARWLGNPAAILMYTLRNMRDTGRASRLLLLWWQRRQDHSGPNDYILESPDDVDDGGNDSRADGCGGKHNALNPEANSDGAFCEYDDAIITIDYHDPRAGPLDMSNAISNLRDGLYILTVLNQYELEAAADARNGDLADTWSSIDGLYAVLLFALFSRGTSTYGGQALAQQPPGQHQRQSASSRRRAGQ